MGISRGWTGQEMPLGHGQRLSLYHERDLLPDYDSHGWMLAQRRCAPVDKSTSAKGGDKSPQSK
jgi:hypothetical protein